MDNTTSNIPTESDSIDKVALNLKDTINNIKSIGSKNIFNIFINGQLNNSVESTQLLSQRNIEKLTPEELANELMHQFKVFGCDICLRIHKKSSLNYYYKLTIPKNSKTTLSDIRENCINMPHKTGVKGVYLDSTDESTPILKVKLKKREPFENYDTFLAQYHEIIEKEVKKKKIPYFLGIDDDDNLIILDVARKNDLFGHVKIGGKPRSGKTTHLIFAVANLIKYTNSKDLKFVIIDSKGSFKIFKDCAHLASPIISQHKPDVTLNILNQLNVELSIREEDENYRKNSPHILCIIDEFAMFFDKKEKIYNDIFDNISQIMCRGKSSKINMILCMQQYDPKELKINIKGNFGIGIFAGKSENIHEYKKFLGSNFKGKLSQEQGNLTLNNLSIDETHMCTGVKMSNEEISKIISDKISKTPNYLFDSEVKMDICNTPHKLSDVDCKNLAHCIYYCLGRKSISSNEMRKQETKNDFPYMSPITRTSSKKFLEILIDMEIAWKDPDSSKNKLPAKLYISTLAELKEHKNKDDIISILERGGYNMEKIEEKFKSSGKED